MWSITVAKTHTVRHKRWSIFLKKKKQLYIEKKKRNFIKQTNKQKLIKFNSHKKNKLKKKKISFIELIKLTKIKYLFSNLIKNILFLNLTKLFNFIFVNKILKKKLFFNIFIQKQNLNIIKFLKNKQINLKKFNIIKNIIIKDLFNSKYKKINNLKFSIYFHEIVLYRKELKNFKNANLKLRNFFFYKLHKKGRKKIYKKKDKYIFIKNIFLKFVYLLINKYKIILLYNKFYLFVNYYKFFFFFQYYYKNNCNFNTWILFFKNICNSEHTFFVLYNLCKEFNLQWFLNNELSGLYNFINFLTEKNYKRKIIKENLINFKILEKHDFSNNMSSTVSLLHNIIFFLKKRLYNQLKKSLIFLNKFKNIKFIYTKKLLIKQILKLKKEKENKKILQKSNESLQDPLYIDYLKRYRKLIKSQELFISKNKFNNLLNNKKYFYYQILFYRKNIYFNFLFNNTKYYESGNKVFLNYPKYLEVNYLLLLVILIRQKIKFKDYTKPFIIKFWSKKNQL